MFPLQYLVAFMIPGSVAVGLWLGGGLTFLTPVLVFALIPLCDELIGLDTRNADEDEERRRLENPLFRALTWLWVPVQLGTLATVLVALGSGELAPLEIVGLAVSTGILGGTGINVAHELMHRKPATDRALAELLMTAVTYPHFCVEHVHGHHKRVATVEDPATARLGETVYGFLGRTLPGGLRSFLRIEARLSTRKGHSNSLRDRRVRYPLAVLVALAVSFGVAGVAGVAFFLVQSAIAIFMLETINYVEHYGLQRQRNGDGGYERVRPEHSWNSGHLLTGRLLFGLPRHSDHHFLASRPYAILRHHGEAPELPAGYATMFLVALCPPLWRRVMDPRVAQVNGAEGAPTGDLAV